MFKASSQLVPEVTKILVLRAVVTREIEVHAGPGLSEENHAALERVRIPNLVVDVGPPICQISEEELGRLDLGEDSRGNELLVFDVVGSGGADVELREHLLDSVRDIDELWSRFVHGHHDECRPGT